MAPASPETFARLIDNAYSAMGEALVTVQRTRDLREQGADPFEVQLAEDQAFVALERTRVVFEHITARLRLTPQDSAAHPTQGQSRAHRM